MENITTKMRRVGGFSEREQLDRVYVNMQSDLQEFIWRREFVSLDDLCERENELEVIRKRRAVFQAAERPAARPIVISAVYNKPVVMVRKKDGTHRFCIDFCKINEVTEKDAYALPFITATLDKLRGARYLFILDLKSGYWQVPLSPESRPITGLMQFKVMPFGLHSAPTIFQRLLDSILGPELEPNVLMYIIIINLSAST